MALTSGSFVDELTQAEAIICKVPLLFRSLFSLRSFALQYLDVYISHICHFEVSDQIGIFHASKNLHASYFVTTNV